MPEQAGQIAEGQGQKGKAERGDAKIRRLGQVKREDDEGREVEDQQRESQGRAELLRRAPGELASEKESRPDKHASGPSRGGGTALRCAAMSLDPRHKSRTLLDGRDRAPARSYLKAIGFSDADLTRPIVGIANTWTETMPCNFSLRRLAEHVKRGVREAGGTPMEFNTIAISDGITMGTEGMKTSLVSREVIADSI